MNSTQESILVEDRFGFDALWAPDGQHALFFETTEQGGANIQLSLYTRATDTADSLRIQTSPDKVLWSKDNHTLYAALPDSLGSIYPDDYRQGGHISSDRFWKIDVLSGKAEQLTVGDEFPESFNATNLVLSDDEKHLFFKNQNDNKIYVVNL